MSGRGASVPEPDDTVVLSGDELLVDRVEQESGRVGVRKVVDTQHVETPAEVATEYAEFERHDPVEADSGEVEVLPDGSLSIPVFEEQLVIEKRLVVRERVIVRKHTVTEERVVTADLRRERVEVDADAEVAGRVTDGR